MRHIVAGRVADAGLLVKIVSGNVLAQSIAFRVTGRGDDPFPLKFWLQVTYPLLNAASFDTFCLVAPQQHEIEKGVQLRLTRTYIHTYILIYIAPKS